VCSFTYQASPVVIPSLVGLEAPVRLAVLSTGVSADGYGQTARPATPLQVDLASHELHVLYIDAERIVAEVVYLEPLGDVPIEREPGGPVSPSLAVLAELASGYA